MGCSGEISQLGVEDGSLVVVSMGFESDNFGFLIRRSLLRCVFVRCSVSVHISLEGCKSGMG